MPFAAIAVMLLVGVILDPALTDTRWWSATDAASIAGALAFPVGAWLVLAAAIVWTPILTRRHLSTRATWIQSLLIAATSGVAWVPTALILDDALGPSHGRGIALPLALAAGAAAFVVALWPRRPGRGTDYRAP